MFPREFAESRLGGRTCPYMTEIEEAISWYIAHKLSVQPQPWILAMNTVVVSGQPAIGYVVVSTVEPSQLSGATGLATTRLQLSFLGTTYLDSRRLARQVRSILQGFSGWISAVKVDVAHIDGAMDKVEPPMDGRQKPVFHRNVDYLINWVAGEPNYLEG